MRVITNEAFIERNKKIAQYLFFVSLALLAGGFFLANSINSADLALAFQCVMIPVMFGVVIYSVRMTNLWMRQPFPWEAIRIGLKGIGTDTVLYNFVLPAEHVLVTQSGIFAIVTRFQDRPQKVTGDKWLNTGGLLSYMRQEQIGNPTQEAKLKALRVAAFLQEALGDDSIQVQPLIVFVNPNARVVIEEETSVPILFAEGEKKDKDTLKGFFKELKKGEYPTLTKEQIAELDDLLLYED